MILVYGHIVIDDFLCNACYQKVIYIYNGHNKTNLKDVLFSKITKYLDGETNAYINTIISEVFQGKSCKYQLFFDLILISNNKVSHDNLDEENIDIDEENSASVKKSGANRHRDLFNDFIDNNKESNSSKAKTSKKLLNNNTVAEVKSCRTLISVLLNNPDANINGIKRKRQHSRYYKTSN